jgi:hypothetical protein
MEDKMLSCHEDKDDSTSMEEESSSTLKMDTG